MRSWWTDASCVRTVKTFEVMPWQYKVLEVSYVLAPIAMTWSAYLERKKGFDVNWLTAGFLWLVLAHQLATYVRGYLALRHGIEPALPGTEPNLQPAKWGTILMAVMVVAMVVLQFSLRHDGIPEDWSGPLLIFALFIMQLSSYPRNRFWDADLA